MKKILLSMALVVFAASASAQDRRPDYGPAVNAAAAKKIAAGIIAECQKNSWNVAVAVVDTHGFLVYFERMDNTQTASMDIAVGTFADPHFPPPARTVWTRTKHDWLAFPDGIVSHPESPATLVPR